MAGSVIITPVGHFAISLMLSLIPSLHHGTAE